jgi:hypothetical protein
MMHIATAEDDAHCDSSNVDDKCFFVVSLLDKHEEREQQSREEENDVEHERGGWE